MLPSKRKAEEPIVLNVGGEKFTVLKSTLLTFPHTMLGAFFSHENMAIPLADGSYFFDRSPTYFPYILEFYRTRIFPKPKIPKELEPYWQTEKEFWGLEPPKSEILVRDIYDEMEGIVERNTIALMETYFETKEWKENEANFANSFTLEAVSGKKVKLINENEIDVYYLIHRQKNTFTDVIKRKFNMNVEVSVSTSTFKPEYWPANVKDKYKKVSWISAHFKKIREKPEEEDEEDESSSSEDSDEFVI